MLSFDTSLEKVRGVGPRFLSRLKKLGMETVGDLLYHLPLRYEDFSEMRNIRDLEPGQECTVQGTVEKISVRKAWTRRSMSVIEAVISDGTGKISAVWFNQPYIAKSLTEGTRANFSGRIRKSKKGEIQLSSPIYEIVRGGETRHTARVIPVYAQTRGLTSKGFRFLIKPLLESVRMPEEFLPGKILEEQDLPPLEEALRTVHFPDTEERGLQARRRFTFEDLFLLELRLLEEKIRARKQEAIRIPADISKIRDFLEKLPFKLTPSQKKSLWEVVQDMDEDFPMNRLLQGDVGSGKTIVAAVASLLVAKKGHTAVIMAPTEILARQHYETFRKIFPDTEEGIALFTASESRISYGPDLETEKKKPELREDIEKGGVGIVIGTHALIAGGKSKSLSFPSLALVTIDEQHRFGIRQRSRLLERKGSVPHFLSMSATPIPRTLSLTIFSNLNLSRIAELPKDRKEVVTKVIPPAERKEAYAFIRKEIEKGRQAFVVCPRINPPEEEMLTPQEIEKLNVKSVTDEFERLSKEIFPDLEIAMLHGKIKPAEKNRVMKTFADNGIQILVSTSVIEVGIDVPNATVMMIEGADRFGLAQLYQFRGRVGRGEYQSYCFLFSDSESLKSKERLLSIVEAKNGLELAERDLKLRGPGEFLGDIQTGMPDLAMKVLQNPKLALGAKRYAEKILGEDGNLSKYPRIRKRLESFSKRLHWE